MELKQNLLGNYKENKILETKIELKTFLFERDNEIFIGCMYYLRVLINILEIME